MGRVLPSQQQPFESPPEAPLHHRIGDDGNAPGLGMFDTDLLGKRPTSFDLGYALLKFLLAHTILQWNELSAVRSV